MQPPADPVGTLADHLGRHWIRVFCTDYACGHSQRFDPADLAGRFGADYPLARLMRQMTCTRCGQRGGRMQISPAHRVDGSDGPQRVA